MLSYDLRPCSLDVAAALCAEHHGYGTVSSSATYAFAVWEKGRAVAAYVWQPPPFGAASSVSKEAPGGVLSLSRMVAVPREERTLNHVSKPLRRQMNALIDRGRWPALVTYSDEGQGHTGHVYKCSGWEKVGEPRKRPFFHDSLGRRLSSYANGKHGARELTFGGYTMMQRWEHWACEREEIASHMAAAGWLRVVIPGKVWRSGRQAHTWEKRA